MCFHNVRIHRNFYQNQFINEYARKKKANIPKFQSFAVSEFFLLGVEELTFLIILHDPPIKYLNLSVLYFTTLFIQGEGRGQN